MPSKLLLLPWLNIDAPCMTYDCYNRIAWKIVPADLADNTGAVIMGLCGDCRESLRQSLAADAGPITPPVLPGPAPVGSRSGGAKRGD